MASQTHNDPAERLQQQNALLELQLKASAEELRSVRLENARLSQAEQQRIHELTIINSIQLGLATRLEIQAIYDLVGNEIVKIFNAQVVMISIYDPATESIEHRYAIERGERVYAPGPHPLVGFRQQIVETRRSVLVNRDVVAQATRMGQPVLPGTLPPKSWLGVPMLVGDRVTGILSLQNLDEENAFTEADVRLLETLANSLSVALENARLFAETQRLLKETEQRNAELATINSVQAVLASKLDLQAIYELIGEEVREVFNVQVVDIVTYDPATNLIAMPYSYEKGDRSVISPREPYGFRLHVINTGESLLINEKFEELAAQYHNPLLTGKWPKSALFAPLPVAGKVKGVISIQDLDRENAFTPSDMRLLQTLANAMSVAIENARLFAETQRLFEAEQRAHEQAEILRSVAQGLNRSLSLMDVFNLVLTEIQKVIPYDSAGIYQVHDNRRVFITGHGFTNLDELIGVSFEFNQQDDEIGYLISQSLQPLILDDASVAYPQYFNTGPHAAARIRSFMAVPIVLNQQMIGLITLDKAEPGFYHDQHARLAMAFAAQAATAINNAQLFEERARRINTLSELYEASVALSTSVELEEVLGRISTVAREISGADATSLYLYDEHSDSFTRAYTIGVTGDWSPSHLRSTGMTRRIVKEGKPALVVDTHTNPEVNPHTVEAGIGSLIAVPLISQGQTAGVLYVGSFQTQQFDEGVVQIVSALANQAAVVISNARLFTEMQRLLRETEQRAAELTIINSVQESIASKLDIQGVIELVGDKLREVFPLWDGIGIRL
ncbi:MAG TPA: GAF domain-containing protein, partial [Anaerolineae bacterium]|nr:GAF domain-containing protein [Anaerolineae bacterium]